MTAVTATAALVADPDQIAAGLCIGEMARVGGRCSARRPLNTVLSVSTTQSVGEIAIVSIGTGAVSVTGRPTSAPWATTTPFTLTESPALAG